ncbi:MAG: tetratricopeptide repeat protein [Candidatus Sericytochromatia bacterium]
MERNQELRQRVINLGKENAVELAKSILDYFYTDMKDVDYVDELLEIGMDYDKFGEAERAIQMYFKAEKRAFAIGDKIGLGTIYSNLGVAYNNTKNYDKALSYYQKALPILEETKNAQELGILYNNFGYVYKNILKYKECVEFYLKSIKYLEDANDKFSLTATYFNLAEVFAFLQEFEIAIEYMDKCIEIDKELKLSSLQDDLRYKEELNYKLTRAKMKSGALSEEPEKKSRWFWGKK